MRQPEQLDTFRRVVLFFLLATIFLLQPAADGRADELVSCRYQQAEGRRISLRLDIGSPPPSMLILVQRIPVGITITKATPPVKKYNSRRGVAKWLLKGLQPGTMLFSMELDGEVAADQINGEIRYKNPAGGKMQVMAIRP